MENIISLDVKEDSDSTIPNIRKGYTVTDKADGLRKLLFINEEGLIYLINTGTTKLKARLFQRMSFYLFPLHTLPLTVYIILTIQSKQCPFV